MDMFTRSAIGFYAQFHVEYEFELFFATNSFNTYS